MIKFELIQAFMTVVECNSFHGAAKKLKKSTAAISQKISALEKQLKVELIIRSTRKLELTPIGLAYYDQCKRIQEEIERANKFIVSQQIEPSGTIHIACPVRELIPQMAMFADKYPNIKLNIDSQERWPDFGKDKYDVAVGLTLPVPEDYVSKAIKQTRYTLCASKEYLKKQGKPKATTDLVNYRYIAHSKRPNDRQIKLGHPEVMVPVTPWIWLNDTEAMLNCALDHHGMVLLHDYITEPYIKRGELVELFPELQTSHDLNILYPYTKYLDPKVRMLIDFILDV